MNSKTGVEEQNGTFYDPVKPQAKNFEDLSTRGGGTTSNLGGPLLYFHLQCSLGGASRHLARTGSQVHFRLPM